MSRVKKVVLFLLIGTSIFLGAILFFPYLKITNIPLFNDLPKSGTYSTEFQAKYGKIDTNQLLTYAEKTIKIPYRPNRSYLTTFKNGVISNNVDSVAFSTYPWNVDKTSTSVELTQSLKSVKGKAYSKNELPLDFSIYVKTANEKNLLPEELLKTSTTYFQIPKNIDISNYKNFEAEIGGKVVEVTWKDPLLNTIESRSVWDINEENKVYFIACRVFKDSPLYEKNTCYYQK